jgi:hypothetical protein
VLDSLFYSSLYRSFPSPSGVVLWVNAALCAASLFWVRWFLIVYLWGNDLLVIGMLGRETHIHTMQNLWFNKVEIYINTLTHGYWLVEINSETYYPLLA